MSISGRRQLFGAGAGPTGRDHQHFAKQCPWDRAQTHETLKACMLEEAYESVEAIDRRDADNLAEELGDVMLQVVFHSNLAQEEGLFDSKRSSTASAKDDSPPSPHFLTETANNTIKSIDNVLENGKISRNERTRARPGRIALPRTARASGSD